MPGTTRHRDQIATPHHPERTPLTSFTNRLSDGVPVNIVQRVMGHEQASTTLNRPTHTPDGYDERVLAAFGAPTDFSPTQGDKLDEDKTGRQPLTGGYCALAGIGLYPTPLGRGGLYSGRPPGNGPRPAW
jgi:hypothetical protein